MIKKAIVFTLLTTLLSSCVTGPEGYFKRSANNKLFDRKGFKGGKRAPLYNKKYITRAKKNIMHGEYDDNELDDDDDLQEGENTSRENIEMYKAMIEDDLARKQKSRKKSWFSSRTKNKAYPSIVDAHHTVDPRTHTANLELKEELAQIKAMLQEAKKDVSSYKCPTAKVLEQNSSNL